MSGRIFADTNILVYAIANDARKRTIADSLLLTPNIVISSQVINEFVAVTLRKKILPFNQVITYGKQFMQVFEMTTMAEAIGLLCTISAPLPDLNSQ